jgi:hypothetical protein
MIYVITALLLLPSVATAADPYALNGPPVRDFGDIQAFGIGEGGVVKAGTYVTMDLLPGTSIATAECIQCHPDRASMLANTPHNSTAVACGVCHYVGSEEVSACAKFVVTPKKLILQRQSMACGQTKCHEQQYNELSSGRMFEFVSCLVCHDPYKMVYGAEDEEIREIRSGIGHQEVGHEHTHGLVTDRERICQPCHSLKAGDSSELSVIHYGIMTMAPGLSSDEATKVSNLTPTCIDCHLLETVDEKGVDHENHKFTFELEADNQTCLIQGCHPDRNYEWVKTQVTRWQGMKATVPYEINEVLFPTPPSVITEGPVKGIAILGFLAVVLVSAIASLRYQRRDDE